MKYLKFLWWLTNGNKKVYPKFLYIFNITDLSVRLVKINIKTNNTNKRINRNIDHLLRLEKGKIKIDFSRCKLFSNKIIWKNRYHTAIRYKCRGHITQEHINGALLCICILEATTWTLPESLEYTQERTL